MFDNSRRGRLRRMAVALAGALLVITAGGPAVAETFPGTIDTPCAARTLPIHADWYLPAAVPRALIWLQHGFARSAANVADLARHYAEAGYLVFAPSIPSVELSGCTLQNVTGNTGFLTGLADLFDPDSPTGLSTALADSARNAGLPAPDMPQRWVFVGHSAGGEAVEYVAAQLLQHHDIASHLAGLVLLDPVASFVGDNTTRALAELDGTALPILAVSGPPALCNNFGSGTAALQAGLH
ncbi:MAG: alpha/beta hydrolase, partial [Stackebrandtia sp.]